MIASLPMYDRPETAPSNDRYWSLIRARLIKSGVDAPEALNHQIPEKDAWLSNRLLLSQTCGLPFTKLLHGRVKLVGTPDYGVSGCPPGWYKSAFVVREDDPKSRLEDFSESIFAYNDSMSLSGWAAPLLTARRAGVRFSKGHRTGAHAKSARAVAKGLADIAAIDRVTWEISLSCDTFTSSLRVLAETDPMPGLPYITSLDGPAELLREACQEAIRDLDESDREILRLKSLTLIEASEYFESLRSCPDDLGMEIPCADLPPNAFDHQ